jgi:pimeloyl-ACP methyl ester carboxylesterase
MPIQGPDFIYPKDFRSKKIVTNGTRVHVRVGGAGPAAVLIHGYGETGDMWVPLAKELARDHTVVVPDLRGMGLSAIPPSGYNKNLMGTQFMRRRKSALIDGAGDDARDLSAHLASHLDSRLVRIRA